MLLIDVWGFTTSIFGRSGVFLFAIMHARYVCVCLCCWSAGTGMSVAMERAGVEVKQTRL